MKLNRIKQPWNFGGATHFAKVSYDEGDFDAAATTETITLKALEKGDVIFPQRCFIVVKDGLNGGSVSAATVELGVTSDTDRIIEPAACFHTTDEGKTLVPVSSTPTPDAAENAAALVNAQPYAATTAVNLLLTITLTGDNSVNLTGGELYVFFCMVEQDKINERLLV